MTATDETTTTQTATKPLPQVHSLTGMRAIAMLGVFTAHGAAAAPFAGEGVVNGYLTLINSGAMGYMAVSYFFVLSGFVLYWSARPQAGVRNFYRRRLVRVFPVHVVVYIFSLGTFVLAGETIRIAPALANLFLVQTWIPNDDFIYYQVNGPTWSLADDLVCYAAFPLLYILVKKISPSRLWHWTLGIGILALMMPLITQPLLSGYPPSQVFAGGSWPQQWFLYFFPLTRALEFVVGMLVARIILSGRWGGLRILPALLLVVASYALMYVLPTTWGFAAIYVIPLALLIGAVATTELRGRRMWISSRPMVKLGDLTYAFYLCHIPVLFTAHAAFAGEWVGYANSYTRTQWSFLPGLGFLIGAYALCLLVAWILYTTVEMPTKRLWSHRRVRPVTEVVTVAEGETAAARSSPGTDESVPSDSRLQK